MILYPTPAEREALEPLWTQIRFERRSLTYEDLVQVYRLGYEKCSEERRIK